jgi:GNAT superfamily N-acetyltransferase
VLAQIPRGSLSAPMRPPFLLWLGEQIGSEPGSLDVLLSTEGDDSLFDSLVPVVDLDHPRVRRARRYRDDVRVFRTADGAGVVTVGRGLAGRREVTFEVDAARRNTGLGRQLARAARSVVPVGEPVFAQVAPGNAAALRAMLAAGFRPIGAEVLFSDRRQSTDEGPARTDLQERGGDKERARSRPGRFLTGPYRALHSRAKAMSDLRRERVNSLAERVSSWL